MSWTLKTDARGESVWTGQDSVFDLRASGRQAAWDMLGIFGFIFVLFPGMGLIWITRWDIFESATGIENPLPMLAQLSVDVGVLALLVTVFLCLIGWWREWKADEWMTRGWTLRASAKGFVYQAKPFSLGLDPFEVSPDGARWEVAFNDVARVEVGRTREWKPARGYPCPAFLSRDKRAVAIVPEAEMQVFLFMADGSRRVIFTGNAARESAATLAHSVRSWLESRRAVRMTVARAASAQEGYDL